MEMPCRCDCGNWFELTEGFASTALMSNKVICRDCHDEEVKEDERESEIEWTLEAMENGAIGRREGKKKLKELGYTTPATKR